MYLDTDSEASRQPKETEVKKGMEVSRLSMYINITTVRNRARRNGIYIGSIGLDVQGKMGAGHGENAGG